MKTLTLAHYYCTPEVQAMADHVGDSLELSLIAQKAEADRIVFAGVRFMAETAKILNPEAEVILPDENSTCSLVEQTDFADLIRWDTKHRLANSVADYKETTHVMYINSSVWMKSIADIIVTSRNVDEVIASEIAKGNHVIFSPDRNMGEYLNYQYDYNMQVWSAVCEVHDKFKEEQIRKELSSIENSVYLIAHPESPLPVLKMADLVGSTSQMLNFIEKFNSFGTIFVATEEGLLHNMRELRPDLDIRQAPIYSGCQCNSCPYMKMNTPELVEAAQAGEGLVIDYISEHMRKEALKPLERMLEFS